MVMLKMMWYVWMGICTGNWILFIDLYWNSVRSSISITAWTTPELAPQSGFIVTKFYRRRLLVIKESVCSWTFINFILFVLCWGKCSLSKVWWLNDWVLSSCTDKYWWHCQYLLNILLLSVPNILQWQIGLIEVCSVFWPIQWPW